MKPSLVWPVAFAVLAAGVLALPWLGAPPALAPDPGEAATATELARLRERTDDLTRRLEALEQGPRLALPERSQAAAAGPGPTGADAVQGDPHWHLDQYVASFLVDPSGSEYFRLAVEAWVVELVSPIARLVRDGGRPMALRLALVAMLGKRRFEDLPEVRDALLHALRPPAPDELALAALDALDRTAAVGALPGLEAALPFLQGPLPLERAMALVVKLAGEGANAALLRLYARATNDPLRLLLLRWLDGADPQAALEVVRLAAAGDQPVRLAAARRTHDFDEPEFDAFTREWRRTEGDAEVLAALGSAGDGAPGWGPKQATGAPNADPKRDDPNAWAPREPQGGLQWLQLTYARPMPAHAVRIFEVNAPGACAEVLARGDDGPWVSVWRGTANGQGSPLWIPFAPTGFPVRTIRLVLDTERAPGWNEIDAVELLGPQGSQWAARASASSTYASARLGDGSRLQEAGLLERRRLR
ncbi:MAG: hypothetical protein KF830_13400 [Planctomycetes bacterium]|nr:hypothetical protein [Planctomycetota bacterium]